MENDTDDTKAQKLLLIQCYVNVSINEKCSLKML